jgi:multidrug efflux system membrane fusion protein
MGDHSMSRAALFGRLSALLVSAALAGCQASAQTSAPAPPPPPVVSVAQVEMKPIHRWDDFTGRLEAVDTVALRPRVSGQIVDTPFVEGARVRKGQVLFRIDPRPFQAEVDRLGAEAQRAHAKAQIAAADDDRGQRLLAQNAIAKEEAERLGADARAARADLGAAEAALRAAELNLSFTRVTAPIDGRVSKALITRGNLVTPQDLLTTLVSDTPIYAAFTTDEQTYLKYAAGERGGHQPVYMGLMTETGFPHVGQLRFLDNALDARSGTIGGRAVFDNASGAFTPGLFARLRLVSNEAAPAAIVPEQALGADLGKRYVLVVGADDRVQYRTVTLGRAVGEHRIVLAGLNAGERIVISGLQKVKPGDKVTPRPAAYPAEGAELATLTAAG